MRPTKPVRIVATEDGPYAESCFATYGKSQSCKNPGLEVEFIHTVINGMLRYPVEFVQVDSYEDMDSALDNDTADIMGISYVYDKDYLQKPGWGGTTTYMWDGFAVIAKEEITDNKSDQFILFRVFNWDIWLGVLCATLIILALLEFPPLPPRVTRPLLTFFESFWYIWLVIILSTYTNLVAITLVKPLQVRSVPFESLDELADLLLAGKCRFVLPNSTIGDEEFHAKIVNPVHNDTGFARKMREAYKTNPPMYVGSREAMGSSVMNSDYAAENCKIGLDYLTMDSYYKSRFCDIRLLTFPHQLPLNGYVFYLNKSSGLLPLIDTVIKSDSFVGFVSYLEKKYYSIPFPPTCVSYLVSWNPLGVSKVIDCFWLLFVGLAITVALFFAEKVLHMWKTRKIGLVFANQVKVSITQSIFTSVTANTESKQDIQRQSSDSSRKGADITK